MLSACEFEIGSAKPIKCTKRVRPAIIPSSRQDHFELLETAQRHCGQKFIAVAEVSIRRCRTDTRPACGIREGEPGRAFLRDQFDGGAHQRLLQIAVVIPARTAAVFLRPAHV